MKEQLVKTKGVRAPGSAQKKKGGSIVQTPGARVELGGEGARDREGLDRRRGGRVSQRCLIVGLAGRRAGAPQWRGPVLAAWSMGTSLPIHGRSP